MRKKILTLSALPLLLAFIGGCGGSGHHTTPPPAEVPVVVTVSDQPPAGINVISFDLSITGACLLTSAESGATSCSGAQNLISSSQTIQFANLQTPAQSDVVANTTVEAGTYTGVLLTFGTGTATVTVDPGDTFTDGTEQLAITPQCYSPGLSASSRGFFHHGYSKFQRPGYAHLRNACADRD